MCIGIFGPVSGEIVSELIFLRYNLESPTQRPFSTSCHWRLQGRIWPWWAIVIIAFLSLRFMSFRRRKLFCRWRWRSNFIATLIIRVLVFVWSFHFFMLGSTPPPFPFSRDSPRWVPCTNFPLVFVGPHEGRASNFIFRKELLPLSIFCCINCIIVGHWWMKCQWIPIR